MPAHSILEFTLYVGDIEKSAAFYRALGVELFAVDEPGQPRHYVGSLGGTAVQLYPAGGRVVTSIQLGLRVFSVDQVATSFDELSTPYELPLPNRLVTCDPDGNRVHLSQLPDPRSQRRHTE